MGKGSRNRLNRENVSKPEPKKKQAKYRKPLSGTAKGIIAGAVCLVVLVAVVLGTLTANGTFKRSNILVHSKTGDYDINQQMATYMVWDALYYTAYYQWSYLSDSIKQQTGITDQTTYCLTYAASGVQDTLYSSINSYANTLKEYVAVCDLAASLGITLSKDERKAARDEIEEQLDYMALMSGLNIKGFLKLYVGNSVNLSDVKAVAELQALYNKIVEQKEGEVEASITEDIINQYVKDNPESFYFTDYIMYSTTDAALRDALLAVDSINAFKTVLVNDALENGENTYKAIFNKYATTRSEDANEVLVAVEKKTTADELNTALAEQEMEAKEYGKDDDLNQTLLDWMFHSDRKQFDSAVVRTEDFIYVVVLATSPADDKVQAAIKEFELLSGESYEYTEGEGEDATTVTDESFRTNMMNSLLVALELLEKTDDMTLYNDSENETIQDILDEMITAGEEAIPETESEYYDKEPEEESFQEWMFKDVGEDFSSPVDVGDLKSFTETEDDEETYNVYMIVDPMHLDTDPLVEGGYLMFEGDDYENLANGFLAELAGLTGDELKNKFDADDDAVVSETLSEDSVTVDELAAWLFDEARAANDTTVITVADSTPDDDDENEPCAYVAFYLSSQPSWKNSARTGYTNDTMQAWVEELIASYELTGMNRIKDRVETSTGTTATGTGTFEPETTAAIA